MSVIGKAIFDARSAAALAGMTSIFLPAPRALIHWGKVAAPGNLLWVAEPMVEFSDKKRPFNNEMVFGDPGTANKPEVFKHRLTHVVVIPAGSMVKRRSRRTLKIIAITQAGDLDCQVMHANVAEILE